MKKKTRKKVVRRKRRSMREKRVMRLKRGLMKRAKKLHLGAKRTGAYVYGTLRRIVGNPRKELTLWGYNPKPSYGHLTGPIRLAEYRSQKQQDEYNKEGWITGVYAKGDEPVGLKLKVEEMRRRLRGNPMSYYVGGLSSLGAMGEQRRKLKIGKQEQAILNFAKKYPGWHGFNPRKHTADVVRRLSKKGLIELSDVSNQFREIRKNPPMYAHRMMSHRTHGLSLKQMMKLYRLVSSGNPKAVMFARRTLGIPMSESLSQVKAVVYHHILDLKGKI